jgi:hypothetical protein
MVGEEQMMKVKRLVLIVCVALTAYYGFRFYVAWRIFPRYGWISLLDVTVDGAQDIILSEIFQTIPAGISLQEAATQRGLDTTLYVKCTIPEDQMTNAWVTQHWCLLDNPYMDSLINLSEGIKWLPSDTNNIDYVCDLGYARMFVMKPANSNRVLYIRSGPTNDFFSSAFWEFAYAHRTFVKSSKMVALRRAFGLEN